MCFFLAKVGLDVQYSTVQLLNLSRALCALSYEVGHCGHANFSRQATDSLKKLQSLCPGHLLDFLTERLTTIFTYGLTWSSSPVGLT